MLHEGPMQKCHWSRGIIWLVPVNFNQEFGGCPSPEAEIGSPTEVIASWSLASCSRLTESSPAACSLLRKWLCSDCDATGLPDCDRPSPAASCCTPCGWLPAAADNDSAWVGCCLCGPRGAAAAGTAALASAAASPADACACLARLRAGDTLACSGSSRAEAAAAACSPCPTVAPSGPA